MSDAKKLLPDFDMAPHELVEWRAEVESFFSTSRVEVQRVIDALEAEAAQEIERPDKGIDRELLEPISSTRTETSQSRPQQGVVPSPEPVAAHPVPTFSRSSPMEASMPMEAPLPAPVAAPFEAAFPPGSPAAAVPFPATPVAEISGSGSASQDDRLAELAKRIEERLRQSNS